MESGRIVAFPAVDYGFRRATNALSPYVIEVEYTMLQYPISSSSILQLYYVRSLWLGTRLGEYKFL